MTILALVAGWKIGYLIGIWREIIKNSSWKVYKREEGQCPARGKARTE